MERSATEPSGIAAMGPADTQVAREDLDRAGRLARDQIHHALFGDLVETPKIGRYTFLRQIGAGGMGYVFAAYDPRLDRKVAIKLIHARTTGAEGRARMLREAQAMARLSHPNVVQVYEVGELEDEVYVAMEYVEGDDLATWISDARRDWRAVRDVFVQAGRGLAAAHAAGLVHRDFKPANVLIGRDGRARVGDFGLARASDVDTADEGSPVALDRDGASELSVRLTATGAFLGTPAYMAPEQISTGATDALSDQYSFAVALYEALYGARPFASESFAGLLEAVLHGEPTPPADPSVPIWLRSLVLRGLHKAPTGRWPSMDALVAALDDDPEARARGARRLAVGAAIVAASTLGLGWLAADARERAGREEAAKIDAEAARAEADAALHVEAERAREEATRSRDALRLTALRRFDAIGRFDHVDDPTSAVALLREVEAPERLPGWRLSAVEALEQPIARVVLPGTSWVTYTPDGEHLVILDDKRSVSLWRADGTGTPRTFGAREGATISEVALSPDGAWVAVAYFEGVAQLFAVDDPARTIELKDAHRVVDVLWGDDPRRLMIRSREQVKGSRTESPHSSLWDLDRRDAPLVSVVGHADFIAGSDRLYTRDDSAPFFGSGSPASIWGVDAGPARALPTTLRVLSSAHAELLVAAGTTTLRRVDLEGATIGAAFDHSALLRDGDGLDAAARTPDGRKIITTTKQDRMFVWDVASGALVRELDAPPRPDPGMLVWGSLWVVSPDSARVARGFADRTVRIFDLEGEGVPLALRGHVHDPHALAFSPDGRSLVTSGMFVRGLSKSEGLQRERGDFVPTIRVWSIPERRTTSFSAYDKPTTEWDLKWISEDRWTRDGGHLIVPEDGALRLLTPEGGRAARVDGLPETYQDLSPPALTRDGAYALFHASAGWVRWHLRAPEKFDLIPLPEALQGVPRGARGPAIVSADGDLFAYAAPSGDRITIHRVGADEPVRTIDLGATLERLEFSPRGDRLVTTSDDGLLRVWSLVDGEAPETLALAGALLPHWSADGEALVVTATADPKTKETELRVWRRGAAESELRLKARAEATVTALSPDGARTAVRRVDNRIVIVANAGAPSELTLEAVDAELGAMAFSPDGAWLISKASNAAYLWSTTTGALVRVLRSPRYLSLATFDPTGERILLAARDGTLTIAPFDADESRGDLGERLRAATSYCYSYGRRRVDLNEPAELAWSNFAACERAHGRDPGERPVDEAAGR